MGNLYLCKCLIILCFHISYCTYMVFWLIALSAIWENDFFRVFLCFSLGSVIWDANCGRNVYVFRQWSIIKLIVITLVNRHGWTVNPNHTDYNKAIIYEAVCIMWSNLESTHLDEMTELKCIIVFLLSDFTLSAAGMTYALYSCMSPTKSYCLCAFSHLCITGFYFPLT